MKNLEYIFHILRSYQYYFSDLLEISYTYISGYNFQLLKPLKSLSWESGNANHYRSS